MAYQKEGAGRSADYSASRSDEVLCAMGVPPLGFARYRIVARGKVHRITRTMNC
jgi:hypothetical protein